MNPAELFVYVTRQFLREHGKLALVMLCLMNINGTLKWRYGVKP